ncbi:MAG: hypothetical protein AAGA56_20775 [Myxococcota bacterium]
MLDDILYFRADDGDESWASSSSLWRSDGTIAGTEEVFDPSPSEADRIVTIGAAAGRIYFTTISGEVWVSDGTSDGSERLVSGGLVGFDGFGACRGQTYFFGPTPTGPAIYATDGTPEGTAPIIGAAPDTPVVEVGGHCVLIGTPVGGDGRTQLLALESTAGTDPTLQTLTRTSGSMLGRVGGRVVFVGALDSTVGVEPWVSDGTIDGTELLFDICPQSCSSSPRAFGE